MRLFEMSFTTLKKYAKNIKTVQYSTYQVKSCLFGMAFISRMVSSKAYFLRFSPRDYKDLTCAFLHFLHVKQVNSVLSHVNQVITVFQFKVS